MLLARRDRYEQFPSGYRYLVRCRHWGVAPSITKALPRGWTEPSNWLTYDDAVSLRDKLIRQGQPSALVFILRNSGLLVADVDADKHGELNDQKREFIDYHRSTNRTLILRSINGKGYHLYFAQPLQSIPRIPQQPRIVLPCEILVDSAIVSERIEQAHWIRFPTKHLMDVVERHQLGQQIPRTAPHARRQGLACPILMDDSPAIDKRTAQRIRDELNLFVNSDITLLDSPNGEAGFLYLMKCLKGVVSEDEFVNFCQTQPYTLKGGETYDQYFYKVRIQFRKWRSPYPIHRRPNVFFALTRDRRKQ